MMWFKSGKRIKIEQLLKASRQDFEFDSESIKARILMAANVRHFSKQEAKLLSTKPASWPRFAFGASFAVVLLIGVSGLAYASNQATPGDALFRVQRLQNQIVLSMPLPESKKEEIRTDLAAKSLQQLDKIQNNPNASRIKVQAAIEESQKRMDEAVSHLSAQKPTLGPTKNPVTGKNNSNTAKLNNMVIKLEDLNDRHAAQIELLKHSADHQTQIQIEKSVISIKANNEKLKSLHLEESSDEDENLMHDNNSNRPINSQH